MILTIYRIDETVPLPTFGTSYATCFDLRYAPRDAKVIKGYNSRNEEIVSYLDDHKSFKIYPGDRLLVPTGLVFSLSVDNNYLSYSIRIHPRSGLALKNGLVLANAEGVVDADYQKEVFVLLMNISSVAQEVHLNERIAQAEVVQNFSGRIKMYETPSWPKNLSERDGGFGSTGKS